ncbi:hypothetical protein FRC12_009513 [Ceratobasidium sp. 428]|nr:hypothetical protein FRC12_009513 [Ceratobasidium sp. 428]
MSACKASNVDPGDSVASSRQRRVNVGVACPNADGTVYNPSVAREARAAKEAQASAATEIKASPFTGDDSIVREPLPTFNPPTPTNDSEENQKQFDEARINYLIRFIAIRDAVDVRPNLLAGKLDLAGLEEINEDPEAAAEYQLRAATQLDATPASTGKGKLKAITPPSTTSRVQEQTRYAGISIDSDSQTVQAKYAPKLPANLRQWTPLQGTKRRAEQDSNARKAQRADVPASPGIKRPITAPSNALARSDHTTLLDGKRLKYPVSPAPNPSPTSNDPSTMGKSNRHASAQHIPRVTNKTSARVVSSPAQLATSSAPNRANNQKSSANQLIQSGSTQTHRSNAAASVSGSAHPSSARAAVEILRQRGCIPQSAPTQAAPAPQLDANEEAGMTEEDFEPEEGEEAEVADKANGKRPKGAGKPYIKTFPEYQQETLQMMIDISKARMLANGTYDDTEGTVRKPYPNWPKEWKRRATREAIVSECLTQACKESYLEVEIPFVLRHVQATGIAITTMRTLAFKVVKSVVERRFQFDTYEKTDWNATMDESLLPLNFIYRHVIKQWGPFENGVLYKACLAVAFSKDCAIGACHREELKGIPLGFLVFVCTLIRVVVFGYQSREYIEQKLNTEVQASAFRQHLNEDMGLLRVSPRNYACGKLTHRLFNRGNLKPKDQIRNRSPIPQREWTPDEDEVYISEFDPTVNVYGGEDVEMAGYEEGDVDELAGGEA